MTIVEDDERNGFVNRRELDRTSRIDFAKIDGRLHLARAAGRIFSRKIPPVLRPFFARIGPMDLGLRGRSKSCAERKGEAGQNGGM